MALADDEDPVANVDVHHVPNVVKVSFHQLVHHIVIGVESRKDEEDTFRIQTGARSTQSRR